MVVHVQDFIDEPKDVKEALLWHMKAEMNQEMLSEEADAKGAKTRTIEYHENERLAHVRRLRELTEAHPDIAREAEEEYEVWCAKEDVN